MTSVHAPDKAKHGMGFPDAPGTTNTPGNWAVTDDRWLTKKNHWTDTPAGKTAIEFVSRITLGGIFYALMENSKAMARMDTYERSYHKDKLASDDNKPMFLEKIAFFLDNTVGKLLYKGLDNTVFKGKTVVKPSGQEISKARDFLRFRETRNPHKQQDLPGRSIGAEMTVVTASFAAMSAGSAVMRNILSGIFNPRERASWSKDGKFDALHVAKRVGKKVWEIGTYNAGEDAAVALPYVFYMRGQRNLLNKVYRGFKYSSDSVDNGGGVQLNDDGRVSDHMLFAGAWDLQGRFTVYNVFTQLYRDLYDNIGRGITQWWNGNKEVHAPEWLKNPLKLPGSILNSTRHLIRYSTISAIRSFLQMTPSVPFFSIFRVPGSKMNGIAVHPKHGALYIANEDGTLETAVRANMGGYFYKGDFVHHNKQYDRGKQPLLRYTDGTWFNNELPFTYQKGEDQFDPHGFGRSSNRLGDSLAVRMSDSIARGMHGVAESSLVERGLTPLFKLADKLGYQSNQRAKEDKEFVYKRLAKESLMAGIPYAAYFGAKVYTRESYVNEQMNMAVERMVDGLLHFNRKEVAAGIGEISNTMMRQPLEDPERQAKLIEKHLANPSDKSPRPIDWNADLHLQAIEDIAAGKHLDKDAVVRKLNQERSNYYANKVEQNKNRKNLLSQNTDQNWAQKQEASPAENSQHLS